MRKIKKETVSSLKKDLDKVFSQYIRQRFANWKGIVECFTCLHTAHWKSMQAGHFFARQYNSTRYDEVNVQCQCLVCNVYKSGNAGMFAVNLVKKYGQESFDALVARSEPRKQFTVSELKMMLVVYQKKIKELENKYV